MAKLHTRFKYGIVVLVGDNLYGSERPQDFKLKFELPVQAAAGRGREVLRVAGQPRRARAALLQAVQHGRQAVLHVQPGSPMSGSSCSRAPTPCPSRLPWLEQELKASSSKWKIPVFHHPLYSSGDRHGSDISLREVLEPLFLKYNVSVVLTGHDHFYERVKPQKGIVYFVVGSGGQLRAGQHRPQAAASPPKASTPTWRSWRPRSPATRCTSTPSRGRGR